MLVGPGTLSGFCAEWTDNARYETAGEEWRLEKRDCPSEKTRAQSEPRGEAEGARGCGQGRPGGGSSGLFKVPVAKGPDKERPERPMLERRG